MDRRSRIPLLTTAIGAALLSSSAVLAGPNIEAPAAPTAPRPGTSMPSHMSEAQKIEALIASVEKLKGAVFIRNGSEYDGAKAAEHLRRKLGYAKSKVKTADQFIEHLATGSSMTGKPYRIRFADGQSVESAAYFREQLRRLEAPAPKTAKG